MTLLREAIETEVKKVYLRRESVKESKFNLELKNEKLMGKNAFKLGHLLIDLFEKFKLPLNKEMLTDYENLFKTFENPKQIIDYVEAELKKKDFVGV